MPDAIEPSELVLEPPFEHLGGLLWRVDLPPGFAGSGDSNDAPAVSRLKLREGGVPLGPAHSLHADIERVGQGRYSHWGSSLWFSTSDGSDPNTSPGHYTVSTGAPTLKVLGFGSCHLHAALTDLQTRGLVHSVWSDPLLSYSPRETLQLVQVQLGRVALPAVVRDFVLSTGAGTTSLPHVLEKAEFVFLELGAKIDVVSGGFSLTRSKLLDDLVVPVMALGREEGRVAKRWYHQGLIRQNEPVRAESAERLLELLPKAGVVSRNAAEIVRSARGAQQDDAAAARTVNEIRAVLGEKPVCVLSTQNMFTPDGRPVTWPGNFLKQLDRICELAEVPVLHPSRLLTERGAAFALHADLHHFTPQFISVLGDEMLAMGRRALGSD